MTHTIIVGALLLALGALIVAAIAWPKARQWILIGVGAAGGALLALLGRRPHTPLPVEDDGGGLEEPTDPRTPPPIEAPTYDYTHPLETRDGDLAGAGNADTRTDEQRASDALKWWGDAHDTDAMP